LHLSLEHAAYLQGATAVGVVFGAALAARTITLAQTPQVLGLGIVLGLLMPLMSVVHDWQAAVGLTALLGAVGGYFVVPMNALLQHRGVTLLSAGRSISVQNTNENASVLAMVGLYSGLLYAQVEVNQLACLLGLLVASGMAVVQWRFWTLRARGRLHDGQV
jgi:MFS transporter, LPLT family, lysophospholipid transporter